MLLNRRRTPAPTAGAVSRPQYSLINSPFGLDMPFAKSAQGYSTSGSQ